MGGCEITDFIFPGGPRRQPDRGHQAGAAGAGTSMKSGGKQLFLGKSGNLVYKIYGIFIIWLPEPISLYCTNLQNAMNMCTFDKAHKYSLSPTRFECVQFLNSSEKKLHSPRFPLP